MKVEILGVLIDSLKKEEVLKKIGEWLEKEEQHYIVTPNPEFLMLAQKDEEFRRILNQADLAIPDGMGLILVSLFLNKKIVQRITGTDLIFDICKISEQKNCSIYLLGGEEGIAEKAGEKLKEKFPNLKIVGEEKGIEIKNQSTKQKVLCSAEHINMCFGQKYEVNEEENKRLIERINLAKPDVLFVAFGQGKQEKWIYYNLKDLPSVKIVMGVGGAFDYISEKVKRAPKFLRMLGLEWLFRLIIQPWRIKRILTATIKFTFAIIKWGK